MKMFKQLFIFFVILTNIQGSVTIETFLDKTLKKVNKQITTKEKQKEKKIVEEVGKIIDYKLMGKLTLGKKVWKQLNKEEKEQYQKSFRKVANKDYVKYLIKADKITVSRIIKKGKKYLIKLVSGEYKINVYMYKRNNEYKIYNIAIEGINIIKVLSEKYRYVYMTKGYKTMMDIMSK
jgi:ABC-type transporter MlaC component